MGIQTRHGTVGQDARVTGHLQVKGPPGARKYFAHWVDRDGVKRTRTLGRAHVKDSGRRTPRGAVVWRAADGPCPAGALTPRRADEELARLLEEARRAPRRPRRTPTVAAPAVPTFGEAVEQWLTYLRVEKARKPSTIQDARNAARAYLLPRFGADMPLHRVERHEVIVVEDGGQRYEVRDERIDTFTTEDVDAFRRELLASHLSARSAQKILVLLHAIFKLAKRRKMIVSNPSEDAERVTVIDDGRFNILEPLEFEAVYRAVLADGQGSEPDAIDRLAPAQREMYGALLSTKFYAGLRLGEVRDLPWRGVRFDHAMIRVESGYTHGARSTPKGKRARSTPLVPLLAQRLAALGTRPNFTGDADYVFATELGERVEDSVVRAVFYAGLERAGLGQRRAEVDAHGNAQKPIVPHDLRHSWCSWAVNVWPVTKVKEFAGHRDLKTTERYVHHKTKAEDAEAGAAYLDRVLGADGVPA